MCYVIIYSKVAITYIGKISQLSFFGSVQSNIDNLFYLNCLGDKATEPHMAPLPNTFMLSILSNLGL